MSFTISNTAFQDVKIIEPNIFRDERGVFYESFNNEEFNRLLNLDINFVQDNHSTSSSNVLRGMHYQLRKPQGKLIRVIKGSIYDVVVDLRKKSKTFGKYFAIVLSESSNKQIWIPEGFAHGFYVQSDEVEILYKMTDYWDPDDQHCLLWNDNFVNIDWPIEGAPIISEKDCYGKKFEECIYF